MKYIPGIHTEPATHRHPSASLPHPHRPAQGRRDCPSSHPVPWGAPRALQYCPQLLVGHKRTKFTFPVGVHTIWILFPLVQWPLLINLGGSMSISGPRFLHLYNPLCDCSTHQSQAFWPCGPGGGALWVCPRLSPSSFQTLCG